MALAQTCRTAVTFMQCSQGALPSLNDLVTQGTILDRLPPQLKHKWCEHKYEVLGMDGAVPFDKLTSWIERQANIARIETTQMSAAVQTPQSAGATPVSTTSVAYPQNMPPIAQTSSAAYLPPPLRDNLQNQVPCMACHKTGTGHDIAGCPTFQRMSPVKQRELGLCFKCLKPACKTFGSRCQGNAKLKEFCTCPGRRPEHNEAMKCMNAA